MSPEHRESEDYGDVCGHLPLIGLFFGIWPITRHVFKRSPTERSEKRDNNGRIRRYVAPSNCMTGIQLTYKLDREGTYK